MKYKEFKDWCNQRACDGCWGLGAVMFCIDVIKQIQSKPFWKRESEWQKLNAEHSIETNIVIPINHKIAEIYEK